MGFRYIPASQWVDIDQKTREILMDNGGLPVNDVLLPMFLSEEDIVLCYGSWGSGKSVGIATRLLIKAMSQPYFKCIYGRKVKDKIRESCFATFCDVIEDNHWQNHFVYSRKPNSSMHIQCKNGNVFIPTGCDDANKIKSIKDPSDIWAEEFDQYHQDDFAILFSRLRTQKARCQFYGSFNTESVLETHWLRKTFFPEEGETGIDYSSILKIKANYYHNYFIDQDEYYKRLVISAGGNERFLKAISLGEWGIIENNSPWLHAFNYNKHVGRVEFSPTFPVYLSFDFNRDPVTCTAWQFSPARGLKDSFIHCIGEFGGKMQLRDLCLHIKTKYPSSILYITGDCSGNKGDIAYSSKHDTAYTLIKTTLGLRKSQMQPNSYNLLHENSRLLMNVMFNSYPNIMISDKCENLIRDCEIATVDEESSKPHQLKKDRERYKMDYFDNMRYFFQQYFHDFAQSIYFKIHKK